MFIKPIVIEDINQIKGLQPDDWSDIIPAIKYYVTSSFCTPIKICFKDRIIGIGASICFEKSAWLAHIIVDPEFRNRGIGYKIVIELLNSTKKKCSMVSLISTELGFPVYKKAGFREVTEYQVLKRVNPWQEYPKSECIATYGEKYKSDIILLDKKVTGENRSALLADKIINSLVYVRNNIVTGFYIPDLGEGLIVAKDEKAGIELMKAKYSFSNTAVLPIGNIAGIRFLKDNGFNKTICAKRMVFGEDLLWYPEKIFSRIGGNFG